MTIKSTATTKAAALALTALLLASTPIAYARGGSSGGGHEVGVVAGLTQSSQDDLNLLIKRANSRAGVGPVSTGSLSSAYEFGLQYAYRFSGSAFKLMLRPSYFMSSSSGSGTDGSYNYAVTGFTIFPMMRMIPLENDFMKFFMQIGLGYGRATTKIDEGTANLTAAGDAFGTVLGLGAEFCINATHCLSVEGNYRYLMMERNIASSSSGTFAGDSISQATANREVELDGDDLKIRMGGIQFLAGYIIHF